MRHPITDAVYPDIAKELKKFMSVKISDGKPPFRGEMIREIVDMDMFIMRVDLRVDRDVLDAAENLKAVGVCAVSLNHVGLEHAKGKGIRVFNAPGFGASATAELTIFKVLDISHYMIPADQDIKVNHIWNKYKYTGRELRSRTLGVVGSGRIDHRATELAKAFGMTAVAYDPFLEPEDFEHGGAKGVDVGKLIEVSNFISLHIPLTPGTKDFFNKESVIEMKSSAIVLNMSRGDTVDEQDVYEALCTSGINGHTTDVTENELAGSDLGSNDEFWSPLFSCDNLVTGPHIGAQTVDASRDIGLHTIGKIKEVIDLK